MGWDPVEALNSAIDRSLVPAWEEMRKTLHYTSSKDLLSVAFGLKSYGDLVREIPEGDNGIAKYAQSKHLSKAKEIGLHVGLLEAYITRDKSITGSEYRIASLVVGEPIEPNNPEAIHFPNLIPAMDLTLAQTRNLPDSVYDKGNKRAFQPQKDNPEYLSAAKAMITAGLLWINMSPEKRVLMLEDFMHVAISAENFIAAGKTTDVAVVQNRGMSDVFHYGLHRQLIPIVTGSYQCNLKEVVDAVVGVAERRDDVKRGPSNYAIDSSLKESILRDLEFALEASQITHKAGDVNYPDASEALDYFKLKTNLPPEK